MPYATKEEVALTEEEAVKLFSEVENELMAHFKLNAEKHAKTTGE